MVKTMLSQYVDWSQKYLLTTLGRIPRVDGPGGVVTCAEGPAGGSPEGGPPDWITKTGGRYGPPLIGPVGGFSDSHKRLCPPAGPLPQVAKLVYAPELDSGDIPSCGFDSRPGDAPTQFTIDREDRCT